MTQTKTSLALFALLFGIGCTSSQLPDKPRDYTLESFGMKPEYHNGEKGRWMLTTYQQPIWVPEHRLCFETLRPMPVSKIDLKRTVIMPNGRHAPVLMLKKGEVTCTCNDADRYCNPSCDTESGLCGCVMFPPCSQCTRS